MKKKEEKDILLNGVPLSEYVDEAEAARQAGMSRRQVHQMRVEGRITSQHYTHVGLRWYYLKEGIEAIKSARRRAPRKK